MARHQAPKPENIPEDCPEPEMSDAELEQELARMDAEEAMAKPDKAKALSDPTGPIEHNPAMGDPSRPAWALLNFLRDSGTGRGRIEALEEYCQGNRQATAEDALEWMRSLPHIFYSGTLQKAAVWLGKSSFEDSLHTSATEHVQSLDTELKSLKDQARELQSTNATLSRKNERLEQEVKALRDEVELLKK